MLILSKNNFYFEKYSEISKLERKREMNKMNSDAIGKYIFN